MMDEATGWDWFDQSLDDRDPTDLLDRTAIGILAARCLMTSDGRTLLLHLRRITIERSIAPDISEAKLRHLEGERAIVRYLEALVREGRQP